MGGDSFPTKIDYRRNATLILTSPLEDLDSEKGAMIWFAEMILWAGNECPRYVSLRYFKTGPHPKGGEGNVMANRNGLRTTLRWLRVTEVNLTHDRGSLLGGISYFGGEMRLNARPTLGRQGCSSGIERRVLQRCREEREALAWFCEHDLDVLLLSIWKRRSSRKLCRPAITCLANQCCTSLGLCLAAKPYPI